MDNFELGPDISLKILRTIIGGTVASASIVWWIWIVQSSLGQLQNNQISFIELLFKCFRSLATALMILTLIAFL